MSVAAADYLAELGTLLSVFAAGVVTGVWWARASWSRGFAAGRSNAAEIEGTILDRMTVESANEYIRIARKMPRHQWRVK